MAETDAVPRGLAKVQVVTAGGGWPATVVVNGQDLSGQVEAVTIAARPGQIPRVVLQLLGDASFEGEGIVEVRVPDRELTDERVTEAVRQWLDTRDWPSLQAQAAEGAMAVPIGEAFKAALIADLGA